jgi:hypothetical protein
MALKSFLSNLIQGPNLELVCEPYKHKSLVDFKISVAFMALSYVKGYEGETVDVYKTKAKMNEKAGNKKTFTK